VRRRGGVGLPCSCSRMLGDSDGDGVISTIFCCRRCRLHSRSPKAITRPVPSPTHCTSMWRAPSISSSAYLQQRVYLERVDVGGGGLYTSPRPKARSASLEQAAAASDS